MAYSLPTGAELLDTYSTPNQRRIDVVQYGEKTYKVFQGTWYHRDTPDEVIQVLDTAYHSHTRLRIYDGNAATGKDWGERWDVTGTVGRSTGPVKIPLLIASSRSAGGGALLPQHLVKIRQNAGAKRVLYQHPTYHTGAYSVGPNNQPESVAQGFVLAVYRDGEQVYGCKTPAQGAKELAFFTS